MEEEARAFRSRIQALRDQPNPEELAQLEEDLLGFFDRVLDTADRSRGGNRGRLLALGQRFEGAAPGFEQAQSALAEGRAEDYRPPWTSWPTAALRSFPLRFPKPPRPPSMCSCRKNPTFPRGPMKRQDIFLFFGL